MTPDKTSSDSKKEFLTMTLDDQLFGIPVLSVQDVVGEQRVTPVPLAPPDIAG